MIEVEMIAIVACSPCLLVPSHTSGGQLGTEI